MTVQSKLIKDSKLEMESTSCCKLCGQAVSGYTISDIESAFCCIGCQTVYNILSTRNELDDFQLHPLFKQAVKSGLISNQALLNEIKLNQPEICEEELQKLHFEIQDLWCPSCAEIIRLLLLREKGVRNCVVDYSTDLASVEFSPRYISKEKILDLVKKIGYDPALFNSAERSVVSFDLYLRFIVAAFFSLNIMMFSYPIYASYFTVDLTDYSYLFAWLSLFASLPVLIYSGWPILRRFLNSLSFGFAGMETLIVMGVSSAFGLSLYELLNGGKHVYFDSMSVIITFVLLGKIIESKAKFSAKETLFRLNKAIPKRGRKFFEDGSERFVLLKDIQKGDLLVALTGEKIVLDGTVIEGEGSCDESIMTGEAMPVRKAAKAKVLSGTILSKGRIIYRVDATEEETALHHIINTIEQDIGRKTHYFRFIDPFIKLFVPIVLVIAFGSALGLLMAGLPAQDAILRAVSVLLISCPCALGIAAPLAESQTLNGMANLGVIIRNRGCLHFLGKEDVFVFDKTGTITEGCFRVLCGLEHLSSSEKRILKGMVSYTAHPISAAIHNKINDEPYQLEKCEEVIGQGLNTFFRDSWYFLGSKNYLKSLGMEILPLKKTQEELSTEVYFARDRELIARIVLGDQIKKDASDVIDSIKPVVTVLLSGDSEGSVEMVAKKCRFDEWKACVNPLEKRHYIDSLRKEGKIVCMMGDGINDAPALTSATIGISVVTATDLSIQVSDVMLTTDRLSVITKMRMLAKTGQKILRQNLFWAFFYNIMGVGLAVVGALNPLISAIAMVLSSLIVLFNARRIKL